MTKIILLFNKTMNIIEKKKMIMNKIFESIIVLKKKKNLF